MITYVNNYKINEDVKLLKEINEKIIQKNSSAGSYKMGREYYLSNKVKHIDLGINNRGATY